MAYKLHASGPEDMTTAALALMALMALSTPDPIRLAVTPAQSFEPATIRATITLEPNALNSTLCLLWDSDDGEAGQHCWSTDGSFEPKTRLFDVKRLGAGHYMFQAAVSQGLKWVRSQLLEVTVLPRF